MKHVVYILFVFLTATVCGQSQRLPLRFRADGTFKIVQFSDLHYIHNNPHAQRALIRMREVVKAEQPDLVVVTGDMIFGQPADLCMRDVAQCLDSLGVPFCTTFGNHDEEFGLGHDELYAILHTPNNVEPEHVAGTEYDYMLPILGSRDDSTRAALYCLDSHNKRHYGPFVGYAWLTKSQIRWYRTLSRSLTRQNGGRPVPSMAFFHIPLPEFETAFCKRDTWAIGARMESVCCPRYNSGMFDAMRQEGDVVGIFCGHDHNNDYAVMWKGILLAYCRYSGGNTVYNDLVGGNGARVIVLHEGERAFETWIRLKNGTIRNPLRVPDNFAWSDPQKRPIEKD